ncbi:MAG TPA: hypothetical protein PK264_13085 [Hyphomicrobiaceae bacterium]|nr:hypothetical protein [Hyphomicrobiaceae bacterium]
MASTSGDTARGRSADGWDAIVKDERPKRDWKKLLLVVGLGVLSWVATYVGMLELIEANMGELPLVHKGIIGFSVAMLMVMVVWLLDQIFAPGAGFVAKLSYIFGYVFLTIISVGFGFGFYWKVLESRSEGTRSAESAIGQVQNSLHAATTRLEQLVATLESLTLLSTQKAEFERANGTSCPASRPGDGPRRKMREDDAQRFTFASDFVKGRVANVKAEMKALDVDLAKIVRDDKSAIDAKSGTRNEFMRALGRKLELTVTGFNAFRGDPQLRQIRQDLAERGEQSSFPDGKGKTFACPDGQLQVALRGVVRAIDQLPELERPKIAVVEGSEAVIEAFRRLTATFYGALAFKLPPSPEELRELQKKAIAAAESGATGAAARIPSLEQAGLSKRDYIPLAIAVFVDLCLLLVSMGRPSNRLNSLVPKMRAAERGPVYQILSRFNQIHHDGEMRQHFELFRHVVFDYLNDYYVAVPLDAPKVVFDWLPVPKDKVRTTMEHRQRMLSTAERAELQREAHLLANLFASFEQEKIFFRIDDRWLGRMTLQVPTSEQARKKLRRQGSKFAEAEAFRIYKFSDGAWSEIILGAVMGAARRVEARRVASGEPEPVLPMPSARTQPMPVAEPGDVLAHDPLSAVRPFAMRPPVRPASEKIEPTLASVAATGTRRQPRTVVPDERHDAQFGPYARYAEPAFEDAYVGESANNNTAPNPKPVVGVTADGARAVQPSPLPPADILPASVPTAASVSATTAGAAVGSLLRRLADTPRATRTGAVEPDTMTVELVERTATVHVPKEGTLSDVVQRALKTAKAAHVETVAPTVIAHQPDVAPGPSETVHDQMLAVIKAAEAAPVFEVEAPHAGDTSDPEMARLSARFAARVAP